MLFISILFARFACDDFNEYLYSNRKRNLFLDIQCVATSDDGGGSIAGIAVIVCIYDYNCLCTFLYSFCSWFFVDALSISLTTNIVCIR